MKIHIFKPTRRYKSISMCIYATKLVEYLRKITDSPIDEIQIEGRGLPFVKDFLSKDLFYPLYAGLRQGEVNHITDHSYGSLAYFLNPKRTVVTCHDLNPLVFPKQSSWLGRKRFLYNIRGMLKVNNIIAVSESTKKSILNNFNYKGNIHVIYNGVDIIFKKVIDKNYILAARNKFMLGEEKKCILHVGSSNPCKNIESILNVLPELKDAIFVKVGFFTAQQKKMISALNLSKRIIQLKGLTRDELVSVYNICDLLAFPSFYEGFGFPVLEAMACGCPVVCSNVSSLPEVGGNAPFYINPYDKQELLSSIKEVLENSALKQKMIMNGLRQAARFSWQESAKQVAAVYQEALKHG